MCVCVKMVSRNRVSGNTVLGNMVSRITVLGNTISGITLLGNTVSVVGGGIKKMDKH